MRFQVTAPRKSILVRKRAEGLEELISFSVEEIAVAKGVSVPTAKAMLTRLGVSKEKLGYKLKRFPLRELKLVFDDATIKGLHALRNKRQAERSAA